MKLRVVPLLGLVLVALAFAQSGTPPTQSQRFQLLAAPYEHFGKIAAVQYPGVFRIDTQTGKVWILTSVMLDNGKISESWHPIEEE